MACTIEDLDPSEVVLGCTDPLATNFDEEATLDDGGCSYEGQISGCTDPTAINYNPEALIDNCTCIYDVCPTGITITQEGVVYYNILGNTQNTGITTNNPSDSTNISFAGITKSLTTPTGPIEDIIGCVDPSALNYNPLASIPCGPNGDVSLDLGGSYTSGCCEYPSGNVTGCLDPNALNYNPNAVFDCNNCCIYSGDIILTDFSSGELDGPTETENGDGGNSLGDIILTDFLDNFNLLQPLTEQCCDPDVVGQDVYWDGQFCRLTQPTDCPINLALTIEGVLIDGDTGLPVSEACCNTQEGYSYVPNYDLGNNKFGACIKDDVLNSEPCDLCIEDVIYLENGTVVYDSSQPTCADSNTGGGGFDPIDIDIDFGDIDFGGGGSGGGSGGTDVDPTEGCFNVVSWYYRKVGENEVRDPDDADDFFPAGTFLLTLKTNSNSSLLSNITYGIDIEITNLMSTPGPSGPCWTNFVNTSQFNGQTRVAGNDNFQAEVFNNGDGTYTITTRLNITNLIDSSFLSLCTEQNASPTAQVCYVYINPGGGTDTGGGTGGCDCGVVLKEFTSYSFASPNTTTGLSQFLGGPNNLSWWPTTSGVISICGQQINANDYLLTINGTGFDSYGWVAGQVICQQVYLGSSFWDNLQNSCFAQYLDTTPRVVTILGRDGLTGEIYLDLVIPSSVGQALLGAPLLLPTNPCNTTQTGTYCMCQVPIGGIITNNNTIINNKGIPVFGVEPPPPTETGPPISPCDTEVPIDPEEPNGENTFENLSQVCCLTLGEDLGWQYVNGVCYWNPALIPTPIEFGLSENEILVDDLECTNLTVSASFYLERPDSQDCEPLNGEEVTASLIVYTGDSMDNTVIQTDIVSTFNLASDGYCQWTEISSSIINDTTTPFKVKLVINGLNECCEYDIFVDDIKVECTKQDSFTFTNYNSCPGFKLKKVIDNKKSWVKNTEQTINRVFAPSPDADLPWRYTNYFEQSGLYERDSRLVLNSKEVYLTFNMCSTCCYEYTPCPNGFTLSAGTNTCYKYVDIVSKQFQDGIDFDFQDGQRYDFMDF